MIEALLKRIHYEDYLKKEDDYAQRWENVKELINFSTLVSQAGTSIAYEPPAEQYGEIGGEDEGDEYDDDGMAYEEDASWAAEETVVSGTEVLSSTVKSETEPSGLGKGKRRSALEVIDLAASDEEDVKPTKRRREETARKGKGKDENEADVADVDNGERDASADVHTHGKSPLRVFLEASTLSTDMEQDDNDGKSARVTIATTHAAKG